MPKEFGRWTNTAKNVPSEKLKINTKLKSRKVLDFFMPQGKEEDEKNWVKKDIVKFEEFIWCLKEKEFKISMENERK